MSTVYHERIADALEELAGISTEANQSAAGILKRVAEATEAIAEQGLGGGGGGVGASNDNFLTPQDMQEGVGVGNETADTDAFIAAIAQLRTEAEAALIGSRRLVVPVGDYRIGTTLDINHTMVMESDGSGMVGGVPTRLMFSDAGPGIRIQYTITEGNRQIVPAHSSGAASIFRGLHLNGGGISDPEAHGFDLMARAAFYDCQVFNWGGKGWHVNATAGGGAGFEGNANCFFLGACSAYACEDGFYAFGADANAGTVVGGDFSQNRNCGINDESFLGNAYFGVHTAGNLIPYRTTNVNARSTFFCCYSEGDQGPAEVASPSMIIHGLQGAGVGDSLFISASGNYELELRSPVGVAVRVSDTNAYFAIDGMNNSLFLGGTAFDNCDLQLYASPTEALLNARTAAKVVLSTGAFVPSAEFDADGINLPTGNWYEVAGLKVLGARQAAIADVAGGATIDAENRTTTNAILAALRNHGIIAT